MRKEYDFSQSVRGKFYTPASQIRLPLYLDPAVQEFYASLALKRKQDPSRFINAVLKKEMVALKKTVRGVRKASSPSVARKTRKHG